MKKYNISLLIFIISIGIFGVSYNTNAITQYEYVTFVINEDYAQKAPDWQVRAQEIIDHVNKVFSEKTSVQYRIAQFKTYTVDYQKTVGQQLAGWFGKDDIYYLNSVSSGEKPYATTILFTVIDSSKSPNINDLGSGSALVFPRTSNDGQEYMASKVSVFQDINPASAHGATILGRAKVNSYFPDDWNDGFGHDIFETSNYVLVHELGHTFALAAPENYLYNDNIDNSGITPKLDIYDFDGKYGRDSMNSFPTNISFNKFNAWSINQNLHHQNDSNILLNINPLIRVILYDNNGNPVPDARVRIYGARTGCSFCGSDPSANDLPSPLLKTVYTDNNGKVDISDIWNKGVSSNAYVNHIVKVDYKNEYMGDYLSQYDVQFEKFYNNKDYELVFKLAQQIPQSDSTPPPAQSNSDINPGWLVKNNKFAEVFYVDTALKLRWIKNETVAIKHFGVNWAQLIKEYDDLNSLGLSFGDDISENTQFSFVNPGDLVKNNKFAEVFFVDNDLKLRWIINEEAALKHFGPTWNQNIKEFDDLNVLNLNFGDELN